MASSKIVVSDTVTNYSGHYACSVYLERRDNDNCTITITTLNESITLPEDVALNLVDVLPQLIDKIKGYHV